MRDTENPAECEEEGQADEDDGERSGRGEEDIGGNPADKNGSKRKSMSKKKEKTSQYYRLKPPPRVITNELELDNKNSVQEPVGPFTVTKDLYGADPGEETEGQRNFTHQLEFIEEVSSPKVAD